MRFLITAIGSMSAECVIRRLKAAGHYVVGCDIYPGEWHYETRLCDSFVRAPFASSEKAYIQFLIDTCCNYNLDFIIPLTDLEIDVISHNRYVIENNGITLCMPSNNVLSIARNKYKLHTTFIDDPIVASIKTFLIKDIPSDFIYPCIAKPYNGRSSEGLIRAATKAQIMALENKDNYIVQEQLRGDIYTVDYCRSSLFDLDASVPRIELLRTKNGAGLSIKIINDPNLINIASHIGKTLDINGCVNFEFIKHNNEYYLIDINPRFSAGVAFSLISGYDMVLNHIHCHTNKKIDAQIPIKERIIIKKYEEVAIE
ncbi:MAG: ATP-grasp domain-containing protein [Muribaculaceae bacterium]|nr:ATP-grasp domain-containing protein [Muribaculaceae bacterium]